MTHEDFLLLLSFPDDKIIADANIMFIGVHLYGDFAIINPESEKRFYDWLDERPLLKALR